MSAAAAYIRVSSKAQNHKTQRAALLKASAIQGDEIADWYEEKKSAKTMEREELQRLRQDCRAGRLRGKKLYLFKLDRLSRSGIRDTLEVLEELREHGCEVVSVMDGFDLQGPTADVIIAVMAWAAKMELQAKNERIAAARERVEAEGRTWGRPKRMNDETLNKARTLRTQGRTYRQIAVALKVPKSTVARALASQKLTKREPPNAAR